MATLDMGGYGVYVWPAYGVVLGMLLAVAVRTFVKKRRALAVVKQWVFRNERP